MRKNMPPLKPSLIGAALAFLRFDGRGTRVTVRKV